MIRDESSPSKRAAALLDAVAVERAVTRPLPAQIPSLRSGQAPACGFLALGSLRLRSGQASGILASASRTAIASSEVGTDDPAHHVRSVFPM